MKREHVHALHPGDEITWNNPYDEQSEPVTGIISEINFVDKTKSYVEITLTDGRWIPAYYDELS